ncbi:hypothetical protein [Liquorilactobacillus satsumensis]|nr:hypothetical protein [Liquorilactobacillus satsumensis]MCP9312577.1 hypothetical protein [Liquorilactobacillus satsumensis]MCP9356770.1 hypothetical protein [Liquorilactobacillus satsumensis]MCP9360334.1 hypothetical protein [Liquorilactobacillus satsumensis]MCP9370710.1 hypothetical protein [Liquorilactobacillus satsumensis]
MKREVLTMADSNETEIAVKAVMKQRSCSYEEAIAFLIEIVKKQEIH